MNFMRKWTLYTALFFVLHFIFIGCVKEGPMGPAGINGLDGGSDKQIRFELGYFISAGDTLIADPQNSPTGIQQFNIDNYVGLDSAIFLIYSIGTYKDCCGGADTIANTRFEIYDLTNDQPIVNSEIVSDDIRPGSFVVSKNFLQNFPKQTIDLGVRIISGEGIYTQTGNAYLFLYR